MSKKLGGNGRWESSRMILPEHREQLIAQKGQNQRHTRPQLMDDEREVISHVIVESMNNEVPATFLLYDPLQDYELIGVVKKIDQQFRRIKIQHGEDFTWFSMEDLLSARTE